MQEHRFIPDREVNVPAINTLVQWMTLPELRDELERTRPAWETIELDGFLSDGQLPAVNQDAHRHQEVADELLRRPNEQ